MFVLVRSCCCWSSGAGWPRCYVTCTLLMFMVWVSRRINRYLINRKNGGQQCQAQQELFSKQELEVLVEKVVSRQRILMGKLDNVVTADNTKRAWAKVAQSVSAVGETERDAIEIKK